MAIAFVGAWTGIQFNASTGGSTATRTVTTGNFLGIATSGDQATIGTTSTTPADTVAVANAATRNASPGDYVRLQYVAAATGSATYTVNISTTAGAFSAIAAAEWSGLAASPLDQASITGTGNSGTLLSASVTTTQADELLLGHGTIVAAVDTVWTAGASYSIRSQTNLDSSGSCTFLEDRIVSSTGSYTAGATKGAGSGIWICGIATFKGASSQIEYGFQRARFVPPGRRAPSTMREVYGSAGVAPQTFFANLSGSVSPSGALAKQTAKPLAGSSTSSGTVAKQAQKAFAGSVTASGTLATIKVVLRSFGGSVTATGALTKQVAKGLAGTSSPSGTLTKQDAKALAGSVTPTGAMAKLVKKAFAGSLTASGALATVRVILRSFGGSVTASGALARQAQKAISGSTTASGTVAKQANKALTGSTTATGALAKLVKKAFAGILNAVGTLAVTNPGTIGGPYAMATLSQEAAHLDLGWIEGDPVSLAFIVQSADWSGAYTAQIRVIPGLTGALVGALTVTATYSAPDTTFTMTMSAVNSALIPAGQYYWDLQQTSGPTRLRGHVGVRSQVTA